MVGREFRLWPLSAASPGPVVLFSLWEMLCEPSGKHRAVCKPQCETQTGVRERKAKSDAHLKGQQRAHERKKTDQYTVAVAKPRGI